MSASRKIAALPLHGGKAPPWLFERMVHMAGAITTVIVQNSGPAEMLRRLSDPFWFQAFGCILGFDWHSSGVTTTVCGALKEAARHYGQDMGIIACGGKGNTSRKTPSDITKGCEKSGQNAAPLIYASRMAARIDNNAVLDGYTLYHHSFFFSTEDNNWCIVQQGMNPEAHYARRYHWLSEQVQDFVKEPHAAIACDERSDTLNMVAAEAEAHRTAVTALSREHPDRILKELKVFTNVSLPLFDRIEPVAERKIDLYLPDRHTITTRDIHPTTVKKVLINTYERQAETFEQLIGEPGIGAQAMRSLSLVAEVIFNAKATHRDPAAYSFAHGGKDGHPYEVNRSLYDANIERLRATISATKLGITDKNMALQSLARFTEKLH